MFGKTKRRRKNRQKTTLKHSIIEIKNSLQVTAKSRKVTLRPCNIFLEPRRGQKGPLTQLTGRFFFLSQIFE